MAEVEEETICILEEIDNTFSSINRTLRDIRGFVERIGGKNKKMVQDLSPWIRFFDAGEPDRTNTGQKYHEVERVTFQEIETHETPVTMRFSSPKNPFVDNTSSEILNRTLLGDLDKRFHNIVPSVASSGDLSVQNGEIESYNESDSSALIPFDLDIIPPVFRNEKDLFVIYEFISNGSGVDVKDVYDKFSVLPREKVSVFVDLLLRKKFISMKEGILRGL